MTGRNTAVRGLAFCLTFFLVTFWVLALARRFLGLASICSLTTIASNAIINILTIFLIIR